MLFISDKVAEKMIKKFFRTVIPKLCIYRETQCKKYIAEQQTEYLGDYTKLEKYKNRVRIIDIFLPALFVVLKGCIILTDDEIQKWKITKIK